MKITVKEKTELKEIKVEIECPSINNEVENLITYLNKFEKKVKGYLGEKTFLIDIKDILYIETVDKKTFLYVVDNFYESKNKLYEIEEELQGNGFMRISKKLIVNLNRVSKISPDFSRRLILTLDNEEKIVVSRGFVSAFKKELEL